MLIGEYLERDFVIDPGINDQISMDIDSEMTTGDVQDLLGVLSMLHGWAINDEAGVLTVQDRGNVSGDGDADPACADAPGHRRRGDARASAPLSRAGGCETAAGADHVDRVGAGAGRPDCGAHRHRSPGESRAMF